MAQQLSPRVDGAWEKLVDRDGIPGRVDSLRRTRRVDRGRHQVGQQGGLVGFDEAISFGSRGKGITRDLEVDLLLAREVSVGCSSQRAKNEITNGLLCQYFPKGTDLSIRGAAHLDWVAQERDDRPRKRLGFKKLIEQIGPLLLQ